MFAWLRAKWRAVAAWRRVARDIHPDTFRAMAGELLRLAEVASMVRPEEQAFQLKARRIREEMQELARMTGISFVAVEKAAGTPGKPAFVPGAAAPDLKRRTRGHNHPAIDLKPLALSRTSQAVRRTGRPICPKPLACASRF
jgi:hypothetical protein